LKKQLDAEASQFKLRQIDDLKTEESTPKSEAQTAASLEGQAFAISAGAATTPLLFAHFLGFFA
jgi:hypothetical protein